MKIFVKTTFFNKIYDHNRSIIILGRCKAFYIFKKLSITFSILDLESEVIRSFVIFSFNGYDLLIAKHVQLTIVALYIQKCCFLLQTLIYQPFIPPLRVMLGYFKCYLPNIYYLTQVKILWKVTLLIEEFDKQ